MTWMIWYDLGNSAISGNLHRFPMDMSLIFPKQTPHFGPLRIPGIREPAAVVQILVHTYMYVYIDVMCFYYVYISISIYIYIWLYAYNEYTYAYDWHVCLFWLSSVLICLKYYRLLVSIARHTIVAAMYSHYRHYKFLSAWLSISVVIIIVTVIIITNRTGIIIIIIFIAIIVTFSIIIIITTIITYRR